jgi:hypothetical protein
MVYDGQDQVRCWWWKIRILMFMWLGGRGGRILPQPSARRSKDVPARLLAVEGGWRLPLRLAKWQKADNDDTSDILHLGVSPSSVYGDTPSVCGIAGLLDFRDA